MKMWVTSLWPHLSWGGGGVIKQGEIFYNLDLARKTWGANNSVYGTYAKLLQFNDYYKGIVLFLSCDK